MFLDDSACNLASLNLMKFADRGRPASTSRPSSTRCDIIITAQEIIVDNAQLPDRGDRARTRTTFRPLGLGYANLGALLMSRGLPYDCDAGRACAAPSPR